MPDTTIPCSVDFTHLDSTQTKIPDPIVRLYKSHRDGATLQIRATAPLRNAARHTPNAKTRALVATAGLSFERLRQLRNAIDAILAT